MSFPVWIELVCHNCATTTAHQFVTGSIPRKAIKHFALVAGWRLFDNDWICKACVVLEKHKRQQQRAQ